MGVKAIPHKSARKSDERFFIRKRCKTAGILCVFQGFTNAFLAKKILGTPPKPSVSGFGGVRRSSGATELLPPQRAKRRIRSLRRRNPQTHLCGVALMFKVYGCCIPVQQPFYYACPCFCRRISCPMNTREIYSPMSRDAICGVYRWESSPSDKLVEIIVGLFSKIRPLTMP